MRPSTACLLRRIEILLALAALGFVFSHCGGVEQRRDKIDHAEAGAAIRTVAAGILEAAAPTLPAWGKYLLSLAPVALAAVGKEALVDRGGPGTCDPLDAVATISGGLISVTLTLRW